MASIIQSGESIYIPFRDGHSIADSQLKPRMYKTPDAFRKSFPGYYLGTKDIELTEYAPVVHGRWILKEHDGPFGKYHLFHCSKCDEPNAKEKNYCPNCGAKMDGERRKVIETDL